MSDRKKDVVKAVLRDRLAAGHYRFGEPISAKALADETGASRFVVIGVLNELRADGFLDITPQVGCAVIRPDAREIADFFVVHARLEAVLAEFAAARADRADIAQLRWVNDALRAIDGPEATGTRYRLLNLDFHRAIHAAARSPALAEQQLANWAKANFFVTQAREFRASLTESVREHDAVIAAIEAQDPAAARATMEDHITQLADRVRAGWAGEPSA